MPDMPCYFATAEQYTAHWNTFHVAVAPTVTCLLRGCGVKFPPGPDSLDAFFRHVKEKHEAESDGGQWRRLKNWARKGIDIAPNPYYWAPVDEPISPSQPSGVQNLDADDMNDPFKAARWIAQTSFQSKVAQARPVPVRDSYIGLGPAWGRGRGTSRGTGARQNRRAPKSSPGFETESQGELNPQTILECGSGSDSRGRDPAPQRGQFRGPSGHAGPSTRKTALPAKQVALKFKKGHKRKQSRSRSNSRDRQKCLSGPSGSEDTVPSSEESVIPEQPRLPSSATQGITTKPSGEGSTYTKRTVGDDVVPLGGRRPGDGKVPESALSVEMLDGQLVYEGTREEPIIKFETC